MGAEEALRSRVHNSVVDEDGIRLESRVSLRRHTSHTVDVTIVDPVANLATMVKSSRQKLGLALKVKRSRSRNLVATLTVHYDLHCHAPASCTE